GVHSLFPPTRFCLRPTCTYSVGTRNGQQRQLSHQAAGNIVYFSREYGPLPAQSFSLACPKCNARYYNNYFVDPSSGTRTYYGDNIPRAIEAAKHAFIESSLCERFATSSACAWVSFTNNSRIYNLEHSNTNKSPNAWQFPRQWAPHQPELTTVLVSDTFYIYALLRDRSQRALHLVLNNHGNQASRLQPALIQRTASLVGPAREGWNHVCKRCCAVKNEGGHTSVMDGIAIGRPCCNVHDCKNPLPSQRARFCQEHASKANICVVIGCDAHVSPGYQTCPEPSHRTLEDPTNRSSLFVLRRRLERLRTHTAVNDDLEEGDEGVTEEMIEVDEDGECPSKPDTGNARVRARFGRRRTHNEQLVVATCGVILGRATMFGSEGIDGTRKHVLHINDDYFDNCAMPVDPFHAKTKHKDSDVFCGQYCNAALFPDLLVENNKWRFNSSAAEMTNAWVGGFQAMVREMRPARYDFFLDEMIIMRNRIIIEELRKNNACPSEASRDSLLRPQGH
ncbi:hypothetical protein C8Q80DRAFT_1112653, partial [Daedaleopsis nitida]